MKTPSIPRLDFFVAFGRSNSEKMNILWVAIFSGAITVATIDRIDIPEIRATTCDSKRRYFAANLRAKWLAKKQTCQAEWSGMKNGVLSAAARLFETHGSLNAGLGDWLYSQSSKVVGKFWHNIIHRQPVAPTHNVSSVKELKRCFFLLLFRDFAVVPHRPTQLSLYGCVRYLHVSQQVL